MRNYLTSAAIVLATCFATANADEPLTVFVNSSTGAVNITNSSDSPINLSGYLLGTDQGEVVFNTSNWLSLQESTGNDPATTPPGQPEPLAGWLRGQATTQILSETNLFGSLTLPPGASQTLGSPYDTTLFSPTQIGEAEPTFVASFINDAGQTLAADVEFVADNNLVMVVDPETGISFLENQSPFALEIDSYLVQSLPLLAVLNGDGWTPLSTGLAGWTSQTGSSTRLGEVNLNGSSLLIAGGGSLPIGAPVNPSAINDELDLTLEFSEAADGPFAGQSVDGAVIFREMPLFGDFNGDDSVDLADYTVWRNNLGAGTDAPLNGNGDGTPGVDAGDYEIWKTYFGASRFTAPPAIVNGASVPEPTAAVGLLLGVGLLGGYRRYRLQQN